MIPHMVLQTLERALLSGYGGIGRRAGFRFQWATVQVQVLLSALVKRRFVNDHEAPFLLHKPG